MRKILLCVTFFGSLGVTAQSDSILFKRLTKPIQTCELIAVNAQRLLVSYSYSQVDSINNVLLLWESYCGSNEPIRRIKMLTAIRDELATDSIISVFLNDNESRYIDRIQGSRSPRASEIFEENRAYFSYTPPGRDLDQWTSIWAKSLLSNQKPSSATYLVCLLLANRLEEYQTMFNAKNFRKNPLSLKMREQRFQQARRGIYFVFQSGIWWPTGRLSTNYRPSPLIHFGFESKLSEKDVLEFGISLSFLPDDSPIQLKVGNSIQNTTVANCITFGGWYSRELKLANSVYFDLIIGAGMGRLDTDLKKPRSPNATNDSYYGVGTIDCSLGGTLKFRVFKYQMIGLNFNYHYSPYSLIEDMLAKDVGNQFATASLLYKFRVF